MTITNEPYFPISISEDVVLPTEEIYSDEPTLESDLHLRQIILLLTSLESLWQDRNDFYAMGNLSIYWSPKQIKRKDFLGPDFFVVLDTVRRFRKSWAVWQENYKFPNVIVEVLSPSTARVDRGKKKILYQDKFRTPEYFWFGPYNLEFVGFRLQNGVYQRIEPNERGHLWSEQLGLYLGLNGKFLRYFTPEGELVPSSEEDSIQQAAMRKQAEQQAAQEATMRKQAEQRAEQAEQQAAQEALKTEKLAARLRQLNIDPDSI